MAVPIDGTRRQKETTPAAVTRHPEIGKIQLLSEDYPEVRGRVAPGVRFGRERIEAREMREIGVQKEARRHFTTRKGPGEGTHLGILRPLLQLHPR